MSLANHPDIARKIVPAQAHGGITGSKLSPSCFWGCHPLN